MDSSHKCQWRGALIFSLICVCTNGWANNRDATDLRRHRAHYGVTVMHDLYFEAMISTILYESKLVYRDLIGVVIFRTIIPNDDQIIRKYLALNLGPINSYGIYRLVQFNYSFFHLGHCCKTTRLPPALWVSAVFILGLFTHAFPQRVCFTRPSAS